MNARHRLLLFALVLGGAAAALVPLQLLAARGLPQGLVAREVTGSAWAGRLRGTSLRGHPLGDLDVRLHLLPLVAGTRVASVRGNGLQLRTLLGGRRGIEALDGDLDDLPVPGLPGVAMALRLRDVDVVFRDGRCLRAGGTLRAGLRWPGRDGELMALSGTPACAERAVVLPLRAEGGSLRMQADIRIDAAGAWRVQATVDDADPATAALLRQAGFVDGPAGLSRSLDGDLGT